MKDNHSKAEINLFDNQSSFWWDSEGPFKTLHQINPLRIEYVEQFAELKGAKVLDIGCGGGILSEALAAKQATVTGLDLSKDSLKVAKLHLLESELQVDYQEQSIEAHAATHEQHYDIAICMELLEHVPNPKSVLQAAVQTLKPGGWLFLSTLNRTMKARLLAIFAAEQILKIVPKGAHHHEQFIKPSELVEMLDDSPTTVRDISGMQYNPFSGKAKLNQRDLGINYFMAVQKHADV